MSPQFQLQIGPFSFSVRSDANGIQFARGTVSKIFAWDLISGAVLVRPNVREALEDRRDLEKAARILGETMDVEKIKALRNSIGSVHIAYREKGRLNHEEIPIPMSDASFLEEFRARLGKRWLGEATDYRDAEKKLHTAPGLFKILFFLFLFLAVLIVGLAFGLFTLFAPILNVLSIRQMYEDFSDRDYASLGTHLLVYVALFVFAHLLRKAWLVRMEARRSGRSRGAYF